MVYKDIQNVPRNHLRWVINQTVRVDRVTRRLAVGCGIAAHARRPF
jgi:hypothetical protein